MKVSLLQSTPDMIGAIAQAASVCYDSDPTNRKKVSSIISAKHLSCLRFVNATIKVEGISRSCSHQIVRHAHLSYLQRSQRYVKEIERLYVIPPSILKNKVSLEIYKNFIDKSFDIYNILLESGIRAEDARYVLPNACETVIAITGNMQAWRDFLYGNSGRLQKAAQWEIKLVAKEIEKLFEKLLPLLFGEHKYDQN